MHDMHIGWRKAQVCMDTSTVFAQSSSTEITCCFNAQAQTGSHSPAVEVSCAVVLTHERSSVGECME